jgi:hypothetical protein
MNTYICSHVFDQIEEIHSGASHVFSSVGENDTEYSTSLSQKEKDWYFNSVNFAFQFVLMNLKDEHFIGEYQSLSDLMKDKYSLLSSYRLSKIESIISSAIDIFHCFASTTKIDLSDNDLAMSYFKAAISIAADLSDYELEVEAESMNSLKEDIFFWTMGNVRFSMPKEHIDVFAFTWIYILTIACRTLNSLSWKTLFFNTLDYLYFTTKTNPEFLGYKQNEFTYALIIYATYIITSKNIVIPTFEYFINSKPNYLLVEKIHNHVKEFNTKNSHIQRAFLCKELSFASNISHIPYEYKKTDYVG